jgi:DNA-binding NarL/FixJ family response regulator/tetratricopeptide (TPR) repeat protein
VISRALRTKRFIGRKKELEHLRAELKLALRSGPRYVIVSGDAGIGKTSLIEVFGRLARSKGALLVAACHSNYREPFSPFADMLGQAPFTPNDAKESIDGLDWRERRIQFYRAMTSQLAALSQGKAPLLVVEDLQWADSGTHDYLIHITSRKPAEIPFVIVTVRLQDAQNTDAVRQTIATLRRNGASEISLESLTETEAQEFLDALPRRVTASMTTHEISSILKFAEGNPLCLEELVRAVLDGVSFQRHLDVSRLAPTLYGIIRERLASLSRSARQTLDLAAACGSNFSVALVAEASRQPVAQVRAWLRAAQNKWLLVAAAKPSEFAFRHALIREIVYNEISSRELPKYHTGLATTLEKRKEEHGILAYHWFAADEYGQAAKAFSAAGDVAYHKTAWTDAVYYFERALQIESDPHARASLKLRVGECLYYSPRTGDAETSLRSAADEFAQLRQYDEAASALLFLARLLARRNMIREARDATGQVVAFGSLISRERRATAYTQLAYYERGRNDLVACAVSLEAAAAEVEEAAQESRFLELRATLDAWKGNIAEAVRGYKQAAAKAMASGSECEFAVRLNNVATGLYFAGQLEDAISLAQQSVAVAVRSGFRMEQVLARATMAEILRVAGRLPESRAQLVKALSEPASYASFGVHCYGEACQLAAYLEDDALLDQVPHQYSLDEVLASENGELITSLVVGRALFLYTRGRFDEVRYVVERSITTLRGLFHCGPDVALLVARFGNSQSQHTARRLLEADARNCVLIKYALYLFDAIVARRKRQSVKARELARIAKRGFKNLGFRLFELMAADAMGDKRESTALAASMGMPSNIWARNNRAARLICDPLTRRQMEIARGAAAGKRNRELATEFGLSEKTVERHLMAILSALKVRSRWQIADALKQRIDTRQLFEGTPHRHTLV